ncbi:phosphoglycerate dehydrogenase [Ensifer sp. IC4062]|nr:phosphoglycerate dehydrogenase [Ensifer sp. IC4062]
MKVLCLWYATDDEIASIKNSLPPGTEVVAPKGEYLSRFDCSYAHTKNLAADVDAIIAFSVPDGILEKARNLKVFSWLHSGVDDLRMMGATSLFKERGVKLANIRGANGVAVAEQAMMFVLALAKQTIKKHNVMRQGDRLFPLYADEHRSSMLHNRTIGLIGVGNIGERIAKHAKGFDMRVLGVRRNKKKTSEYVDAMYGMDELHSVIAESDYIVLAAPNTPETDQFWGKPELEAMKPSAYLINISRGSIVQEKPLYDALQSGRLRGYASDVWPIYQYGRSFPIGFLPRLGIHQLPNVIVSDDQAANADDVLERNIAWGTQNIAQFFAGEPMTREVNLDLGY